jgi:hypothetical protein
LSWIEIVLYSGVLAVAAAFVYRPHVANGGFYLDDWSHASDFRDHGWWWMTAHLWRDVLPGRPILAALLPVPYALLGNHPAAHLAMGVVLGVLTALCFYVFLRALSLESLHAGTIALLSLLFPWSEAARLWPTASINNLAVCAYLLGTVIALRGLRFEGRRAVLIHGLAVILYVLSVLIYEVAACAILLSVLLYRTRAPLRRAARRWLVDVVVVVSLLGVSAVYTSRVRHVGSLAERLADIPHFSRQGLSIFASAFLPRALDAAPAKVVALLVVAGLIGRAAVVALDPRRRELRRWLSIFALATAGLVSAYVMFLGSTIYPLDGGLDTRLNIFAGLAFVTLSYAVLVITAELLRLERGVLFAAIALASVLLALNFGDRLRADIRRWDRATVLQRDFLSALKQTAQRPSAGSTIYTFGYPAEVPPGIPIFTHYWDMNGAVRLTFNDPSLDGRPIYVPGGVVCTRAFVYPTRFGLKYASNYGKTLFVDLRAHKALVVRSQSRCDEAKKMFRPGALNASSKTSKFL